MKLTSIDTVIFLINISVMLFTARAFGELLRRFKQPAVVGEIIAGIFLGPTIMGVVLPNVYKNMFVNSPNTQFALDGITTLAVIMLMLVSGLEVDLNIVFRQKKAAFTTSLLGILFPFTIGFVAAYYFPHFFGYTSANNTLVFALFIGTALSITALPVVARTLMDLNILKTEIGFLIIASAMFNDLIGWLIFSLILGILGGASLGIGFGTVVLSTLAFVFFTLFIGRKIINRLLPSVNKFTTFPGGVLNFILILGFLSAALTEFIGIHAIFGAFIIGIAIGDSVHLKEETRELIQQFVTNIFAPLFFVTIGLSINFIENFNLLIVLFFIVLAFIGKVVGCSIGAYWGGIRKNAALAVGFGMNSRGAMEIVLGLLALKAGLIQEKIFVALVIMALVTSISSSPFMSFFLKRHKRKSGFLELLEPGLIFYSTAADKHAALGELSGRIAKYKKMDSTLILKKVMERENQLSTGIGRNIAIPHAKLKCDVPIVALSINKQGIDFDSLDSQPVNLIFCLIVPEDHPEIQLNLLSEISRRFRDHNLKNELLLSSNTDEIINKLSNVV